MHPDVVVVAGDLTTAGYEDEYIEAAGIVAQIEPPKVIIPGNHDARNVGWVHFERYFGNRFSRLRRGFDPVRAERLRATGFTVVGVDSSEPDLDEGRVGRDRYQWIRNQFEERATSRSSPSTTTSSPCPAPGGSATSSWTPATSWPSSPTSTST